MLQLAPACQIIHRETWNCLPHLMTNYTCNSVGDLTVERCLMHSCINLLLSFEIMIISLRKKNTIRGFASVRKSNSGMF